MKIRIYIATLIFTALGSSIFAQEAAFEFNKEPKLHRVADAYKKESAVYIISDRKVAFSVVEENRNTYVQKSMTTHSVVKVLDDKGVEAFNKIHLPINKYLKYTTIKAQCLTAEGKLIEIKEDKIRKQKDNEGREEYFIAFEGVDIGAEIEFLLTSEQYVSQLEGQSSFNTSFPILSSVFHLEVPKNLIFEMKGYNGFSESTTDTLDKGRVLHIATLKNTKPLPDQSYGNSFYLEPRIAYRLSYIPARSGSVRINSWNDLAQSLNKIYLQYDKKKDEKKILSFLKDNNITKELSEKDRVIKIEEAIKSKIVANESLAETNTIGELIKNKAGNGRMITKLYCACFDLMDVSFALGLSSNRYEHILDENFELWNELDIFLFGFDNLEGYVTPEDVTLRYPLLPIGLYGNKALMCKTRTLGGIITATADITTLHSLPAEKNNSDMVIDIKFDEKTMDPIVATATKYYGLSSTMYGPIFAFTPESKHKEILIEIAGIKEKEENIKSYAVKDYEMINIPKEKPVIISTEIVSPQLMSKAGNTYLLKVGECIGRQSEMYEEEERVLPIDIQFTHHLVRKISIDLIPGYKIKNLNDIVIDKQYGDYGFISSYKEENGRIIIDIDEYYKKLEYPKEQINNFRSVINAAADFNKVTLVYEKE